jgi:uncharacterized low-complexity protein
MSATKKPVAIAVSAALAGGLLLSGSAFASTHLAQGYLLGAATGEKAAEGKCGEGKCGMDKMDTDKDGKVSKAEYDAAHKDGGGDFAMHDADKDGFISADEMKATEGKCGEGKCGEGKCGAEKKAGEGSCGGDKKAGEASCGGAM